MSFVPRRLSTLAVVATLTIAVTLETHAQTSVQGAWTVSEWVVDGATNSSPQPGIFIFTSTHYSIFFVNQPDPRATPAVSGQGGMTDADKVVAYDEFTANAGRYTIEGNKLTTRAYLAKNPGYMASWPENTTEYTVSRNGTEMTLTFGNGNVAKLIRREGSTRP